MSWKMLIDGEVAPEEVKFDYDLFIIGGDSGGVRTSRTSTGFGAKDFNIRRVSTEVWGLHSLYRQSSPHQLVDMNAYIWTAPLPGTLKLNTDAAFMTNKAVVGCIIGDHHGNPVLAATYLHSSDSALNAEILALQKSFELILRYKLSNVTIETDCLNAVTLLAEVNGDPPWRNLRQIRSCRRIKNLLPEAQVVFIIKQANQVAHLLARSSFNDNVEFEDF